MSAQRLFVVLFSSSNSWCIQMLLFFDLKGSMDLDEILVHMCKDIAAHARLRKVCQLQKSKNQ